jgi:hypothetical protein
LSLYLETEAGKVRLPADDEKSGIVMGKKVVALLSEGNEWVRLRASCCSNWVTTWTVLERNELGQPVALASEDFEGTYEVLTAGDDG